MSLLGVVGVIFVVLKLVSVISWSWWLVLLPFYLEFAILFLVFIVWAATSKNFLK